MKLDELTAQVDIALATYNGSKFLEPLLNSIRAQNGVSFRVVASDDGSTDDTVSILDHAAKSMPLTIAHGTSRGNILRNFESALQATNAPFVALSDQDDFWYPNKLSAMLARAQILEKKHGLEFPILIFCDLKIVDQHLRLISSSFFDSTLKSSSVSRLDDVVINNHVPGCCMLFNRALIDKALPFPDVDMHDHWLIQVAALFGTISYVDEPLIMYRQHGFNNVGLGSAGRTKLAQLKAVFTTIPIELISRPQRWLRQATAIRRNMTAIRAKFGLSIKDQANLGLIEDILSGNLKRIHARLRNARTGERSVDYWGILWALAALRNITR